MKKIIPAILALTLTILLLLGSGCAALQDKWNGLTPGEQAAAKAAAQIALSVGLGQIGDSVHELKPYTDRLTPLFSTTFASATTDPKVIGAQLSAHVQAVVPVAQQPAVKAALVKALTKPGVTAGAAQDPQARYNAAVILKL